MIPRKFEQFASGFAFALILEIPAIVGLCSSGSGLPALAGILAILQNKAGILPLLLLMAVVVGWINTLPTSAQRRSRRAIVVVLLLTFVVLAVTGTAALVTSPVCPNSG